MQTGGRKYNDPYYDKTDVIAAQKVGIPLDVLRGIRLAGEQSNENQVSGANARGVYQFIPDTRIEILKKYGVDAWKPEEASLAAAYLLKENADRNNGDYTAAIREYHGGTKRKNWGPVNRKYINRVSNFMGKGTNYESSTPQMQAPQMQAPDMSYYNDIISEMSKGRMDWTNPKVQEMYQKSPDFTQNVFKAGQTQQEMIRAQQLQAERESQEAMKEKIEYENQQIQSTLIAKQQERQQVLSMIPQARSVTEGIQQTNIGI